MARVLNLLSEQREIPHASLVWFELKMKVFVVKPNIESCSQRGSLENKRFEKQTRASLFEDIKQLLAIPGTHCLA